MPQLSIETFVTQYFWLVVILLSFYYIVITQILPNIAKIFKTRIKLESTEGGSFTNDKLVDSKLPINSYKIGTDVSSQKGLGIEKAKFNWIKKHVRNIRNST